MKDKVSLKRIIGDEKIEEISDSLPWEAKFLAPVKCLSMHNHLEDNWNLSNKKALYYNLRSYCEAIGEDYRKYMPCTFHISHGVNDREYLKFREF